MIPPNEFIKQQIQETGLTARFYVDPEKDPGNITSCSKKTTSSTKKGGKGKKKKSLKKRRRKKISLKLRK